MIVDVIDYYLMRGIHDKVVSLCAHFPDAHKTLIVATFPSHAGGLAYATLSGLRIENAELH